MLVSPPSDIVKNDPDPIEAFGLLIKKGFFDAPTCRQIVMEMRSGQGKPATVYGRDPSCAVDNAYERRSVIGSHARLKRLSREDSGRAERSLRIFSRLD